MTTRQVSNDPTQVQRMYRYLAGTYDTIDAWGTQRFFRRGYEALNRAFTAHLPPDGRILDLGCGTGLNVERLLALKLPFGSYVGVDLTEEMLARARAKYSHLEKVSFRQLDLSHEALPEGPFDLVISTWVFEHLPDPVSVVEKAWERLAPGGHAVLLFMIHKGRVNVLAVPLLRMAKIHVSYGTAEDIYQHFPGLISAEHFIGGAAALIVLRKT